MIFIFEMVLLILILYEYNTRKTMVTPICLLGSIYLIAMPTIYVLHTFMDIYTPTDFNLFMTLTFFVFVFIIGRAESVLYLGKRQNDLARYQAKILTHVGVIFFIFLIGLVFKGISFLQVLRLRGLGNMKRGEFGIFANLGYLAEITSPYVFHIGIKKRKVTCFVLIGIELLILILFEVKGSLLLVVLQMVLFHFMMEKKVSIGKTARKAIGLGFLAIAAFIVIYAYIPTFFGNSSGKGIIEKAFQEFVHYLFSPFICANGFFKLPAGNKYEEGYRVILNPFIALYERFIGQGNYPDIVIHEWPDMSQARGANVGGVFSESVYQIGYEYAFVYIGFIALIIYVFFNRYYYSGKTINGVAALLSRWVLCFFGNYFAPTTAFQVLIYCFILDYVLMLIPAVQRRRIQSIRFTRKKHKDEEASIPL